MATSARGPGHRPSFALPAARVLLGSCIALVALLCAIRGRGASAVVLHGAFALATVVGLRVGSWPVLCTLAGAYLGGVAGPSFGDSPLNARLNGLLLAVCGAAVGYCLRVVEAGTA